jgi:invasion protein IalB
MIFQRLSTFVGGFAVASMLVWLPTGASAMPTDGQKFQDWIAKCEKAQDGGGTHCFIAHEVIATKDDKPIGAILQVRVGYWGQQKQIGAIFVVPTGFFLPPGLKISIDDGEAITIPVERCSAKSCIATMALTPEMVGRLKAGSKGTVTFYNRPDKPIEVPFSLSGFTAGLASLN